MSNWIKVTDQLPDLHRFTSGQGWNGKTYVLGVDAKGRMGIGFFSVHGFTSAKSMGEATHWMPLPEPPSTPEPVGGPGWGNL